MPEWLNRMGTWTKEKILRPRWQETKDSVRDVVAAPIGGVIDATRAALDAVFVKPFTEVLPAAGALVTQPLLRLGRAGKNLLTLHPLKAAAEIGAAALVDIPTHVINTVQTVVNWVADAVRSVIPGLGRAVIGAVTTTDTQRLKTTPYTGTVTVPTAFGAPSPPETGPILWSPGGSVAGPAPAPAAHP